MVARLKEALSTHTLPLAVIGGFVSLASRCTLPLRWLLSEDDRQIHPEAQRWMAERL